MQNQDPTLERAPVQAPQRSHKTAVYLLATLLVVLLAAGVVVYLSQEQRIKTAEERASQLQSQQNTQNALTQQSTTPAQAAPVAFLDGKLTVVPVDGWTKGSTSLDKTLEGQAYRVIFQSQVEDYLKSSSYGGYASTFATVTTAKGTKLYILKLGSTSQYTSLVVSTCEPVNGYGCSPVVDGKKAYISLNPYQQGGQAWVPLDYSKAATTTAAKDFEKMVQSLSL